MPLNTSRMGVSSCPPNGVVEDRRFLMTVLMQSLCPEDDFRLLKFSKSLLLAWDMSIWKLPMNLALLPHFFAPSTINSWKHVQYSIFFFCFPLKDPAGFSRAQQSTGAAYFASLVATPVLCCTRLQAARSYNMDYIHLPISGVGIPSGVFTEDW